jgi:hypothetical protein
MATHTVVPPPSERRTFLRRPGKMEVGPLLPLEGLAGELTQRCEKGSESLEGVADDGERMYADPPLCFLMCRVRGAMPALLPVVRLVSRGLPVLQCSEAVLPDGVGWMYAATAHPYADVVMHTLFDVVAVGVAVAFENRWSKDKVKLEFEDRESERGRTSWMR